MTFRKILLLLILTGLTTIYSCDRKRVFESYNPLPKRGWEKDSVLTYSCEIKDALISYNLYLNVRNSVDYPYSNIWLFVTTTPPVGVAKTDTIELALADPTGKWFGSGYGKFRDNKFAFRNGLYFTNAGMYNFTIRHGMRSDVLEGISDIGIRVEKTR
jgi:gliding motility-associated lipoprotein GldH